MYGNIDKYVHTKFSVHGMLAYINLHLDTFSHVVSNCMLLNIIFGFPSQVQEQHRFFQGCVVLGEGITMTQSTWATWPD